jgi:hypothetical protein
MFLSVSYQEQAALILALLCSGPSRALASVRPINSIPSNTRKTTPDAQALRCKATKTTLGVCAEWEGTHPWNSLNLDLQECILMHLPLHDLGKAVCLGKAFRSAFQRRRLQVEQSLTLAGIATSGMPLLNTVGQLLQRYIACTDLTTGCGPLRCMDCRTIDECGTITSGDKYIGRLQSSPPVHAAVYLDPRDRARELFATQPWLLRLWGGYGKCAFLTLTGPTPGSSAMHRNDRAKLVIHPNTPRDGPEEPCAGLGAMLFLACRATEGPMCQECPKPTQQLAQGNPVVAGVSVQGNPWQPLKNPGNPLQALDTNPGPLLENLGNQLPAHHAKPGQPQETPGKPLQAPSTNPGQPLENPGNLLQAPNTDPGQPPENPGTPLQAPPDHNPCQRQIISGSPLQKFEAKSREQ